MIIINIKEHQGRKLNGSLANSGSRKIILISMFRNKFKGWRTQISI